VNDESCCFIAAPVGAAFTQGFDYCKQFFYMQQNNTHEWEYNRWRPNVRNSTKPHLMHYPFNFSAKRERGLERNCGDVAISID
jgi:hypothetical protein